MDVKEAIQELGNVVNHCSYLMPKEWRERHLEDAKNAVKVLSDGRRREQIEKTMDWCRHEILSCRIAIKNCTAEQGLMEELIGHFTLALEGLEKL